MRASIPHGCGWAQLERTGWIDIRPSLSGNGKIPQGWRNHPTRGIIENTNSWFSNRRGRRHHRAAAVVPALRGLVREPGPVPELAQGLAREPELAPAAQPVPEQVRERERVPVPGREPEPVPAHPR